MRKDWSHLEKFRRQMPGSRFECRPGDKFGCFSVAFDGYILNCIATDGDPNDPVTGQWEHVSVHALDLIFKKQKTPTWAQMCHIKELFWEDDECVVQYHPKKEDYISIHDHVLHLWRPKHLEIPMPPKICV